MLCPEQRFGVGLHSLKTEYVVAATRTLTRAINSNDDLGHITLGALFAQLEAYGHLPAPPPCHQRNFHSPPLALRLLTLMHDGQIQLHAG